MFPRRCRPSRAGEFLPGRVDAEQKLQTAAWCRWRGNHQGEIVGGGNYFSSNQSSHDGNAYQLTLAQPLPFRNAILRARYLHASAAFSIHGGSSHRFAAHGSESGNEADSEFDLASWLHRRAKRDCQCDNSRTTISAAWDRIHERIRLHFGFDHRSFSDDLNTGRLNRICYSGRRYSGHR